nr:hypothetical protein [Mycobacterium sp. JS623]
MNNGFAGGRRHPHTQDHQIKTSATSGDSNRAMPPSQRIASWTSPRCHVDRFSPRRVLSTQFGALAVSLGLNTVVGTPWLLALMVGAAGGRGRFVRLGRCHGHRRRRHCAMTITVAVRPKTRSLG